MTRADFILRILTALPLAGWLVARMTQPSPTYPETTESIRPRHPANQLEHTATQWRVTSNPDDSWYRDMVMDGFPPARHPDDVARDEQWLGYLKEINHAKP